MESFWILDMKIDFTKTTHIVFFAGILPITSYYISLYFNRAFPDLPFWVESISPLYAYGAIYLFFEKFAWHWKIFSLCKIVNTPDLRGRWIGAQQSSYAENGEKFKSDVAIEIRQSFSKIIVKAYYDKSSSESVVADFYELNGQSYLFYTYDNDPNSLKSGTMERHKGTSKLEYLQNEKRLLGSYFNSIGNIGEIDVSFQQSKFLSRLHK